MTRDRSQRAGLRQVTKSKARLGCVTTAKAGGDFVVCTVASTPEPHFRSRSPWWRHLMNIPWPWPVVLCCLFPSTSESTHRFFICASSCPRFVNDTTRSSAVSQEPIKEFTCNGYLSAALSGNDNDHFRYISCCFPATVGVSSRVLWRNWTEDVMWVYLVIPTGKESVNWVNG